MRYMVMHGRAPHACRGTPQVAVDINSPPETVCDMHEQKRDDRPYWRRAHRDWRFWVGACCVLVAMILFVAGYSLVWLPHRPPR